MVGIKYGAPVISATQLNSEGYKNNAPGLGSLTESKKKVEHADFIGLLCKGNQINNDGAKFELCTHIRKNRNGPLGDVKFEIDYSKMIIDENNGSYGTGTPEIPKINIPLNNFTEVF